MDFGNINEQIEPRDDGLPQSPNCSDADFAAGHPGLCPNETLLVLKPERVIRCGTGGLIIFQAFTSAYYTETRLTSGMVYESSNTDVLTVTNGGIATIVGPGEATVSVTSGSFHAFARVTVLPDDACCDDITVLSALALDNSRSMSQAFGEDYPTKLYVAKELARHWVERTDTEKDAAAVLRFAEYPETRLVPSTSADDLADTLQFIGPTLEKTDIRSAILNALELLDSADFGQKVLIILSDGEQRPVMSVQQYEALAASVQRFKDAGGVVITCGIRAKADGYVLLRNLGSAGFFLNVFGDDSMQAAVDYLIGSMGYFCAASPLAGGYGYGYLDVAQLPDPTPLAEVELFESSAG